MPDAESAPLSPRRLPLRFGPAGRFDLQPAERRLLVDGKPAGLGARALDLLITLTAEPGHLITKNELLDRVWPGLVVEEGNLHVQISNLRRLIGGDVIATVPGRGYRFSADALAPAMSTADEAGAAAAPVAAAATRAARLRTNLPDVLPPLIGRDDDLAALDALVNHRTLVTVLGAGGIGKTSLAITLCARRRHAHVHGVCWVELAGVQNPAQLPSAIAAALDVALGTGDHVRALAEALAHFDLLLALDNAEHLLDAVAAVAEAIGQKAPKVRLLLTSQAPLRVRSECLFRLTGLAVPTAPVTPQQAMGYGAVTLFVERARAADPRFELEPANVDAVVDLCRSLEGSALAIELAAARLRLLGVNGLRAALDERLHLLKQNRRGVPARQQTLRAAVEWSHGLLKNAEQAVFRRLAVFVSAPDLGLLREVLADEHTDEWQVLDLLSELVDRSLVSMIDGAEPRYRLLDSPRALAIEKLDQAGERAMLQGRHARAFAKRCASEWDLRWNGGVREADQWRALAHVRPDLRAAFDWGCAHDPAAAAAIAPMVQSPYNQAERRVSADANRALHMRDDVPPGLAGRAAWIEASLVHDVDPGRAHVAALRAVALFAQAGDSLGEFLAQTRVIESAALLGDRASGEAALQRARDLDQPDWPPQRRQRLAYAEGRHAGQAGDAAQAMLAFQRAAALDEAAGIDNAGSLIALADAEWLAGHLDVAQKRLHKVAELLRGTRNELYLYAFALSNLAGVALARNDLALARRTIEEGWPHAPRLGAQPSWLDHMALLAALENRPRAAARLLGYSEAAYRRANNVRQGNETIGFERATRIVVEALGPDVAAALREEGRGLRDEDVAALALGAGGE